VYIPSAICARERSKLQTFLVVRANALCNGLADGIDLGDVATTADTNTNIDARNLVATKKENGLKNLVAEELGLNEFNWAAVHLDKALTLLAVGNSNSILLKKQKTKRCKLERILIFQRGRSVQECEGIRNSKIESRPSCRTLARSSVRWARLQRASPFFSPRAVKGGFTVGDQAQLEKSVLPSFSRILFSFVSHTFFH